APFIKMFPVGLGLRMMVASTLLTTLLFFLVLPFFGQLRNKGRLAQLFLLLFFGFGIASHIQSDFGPERPNPSSLVYLYDADRDSARWATYVRPPMAWNEQYPGADRRPAEHLGGLARKYGTKFSLTAQAQRKDITLP